MLFTCQTQTSEFVKLCWTHGKLFNSAMAKLLANSYQIVQ